MYDKEVREGGKKERKTGWRLERNPNNSAFFSAHWWNLIGFPLKEGGRERIKKMRFSFHCVIFFSVLIATDILLHGLGA